MNSLVYQIGVKVLEIYLNIACFTGNQKAKKAKIGRRNWKNHLELFKKKKKTYWIHAASHGEAIMALPIIEKKYNSSKEDKKILMYCTGGIRCEKASAYLINKGYKNVYQLNGGIIEYARQVKEHNLENKFLGKNFVFDNRRSERISGEIISNCHQCGDKCDEHVNCNNEACHLLFIQCESCAKKYDGCCSIECSEINSLPLEKQKELRRGKKNSNKIFKKGRFKEKPLNKI